MKSYTLGLVALAAFVVADPLAKRAPTDTDILQYALTLEHLEAFFYSQALEKFDEAAFAAVNADRSRVQEIAAHEAQHVSFLASALADKATAPCNYTFPYTDVTSFMGLASIIEGVGVSAYLGAAQYIENPAYLTAAASILTTEARHQAYLGTVTGSAPWSGPEDSPLDLDHVYSLVTPFITSCPSSNPSLPVKAFPALNVTSSNVTANSNVTFTFNATGIDENAPLYAAFISGLNSTYVPVTNNSAVVPAFNGTVYMVVTKSNTNVTGDNTIAGPAILSLGGLQSNVTGFLDSAESSSSTRGSKGNGSTSDSDSSSASALNLKHAAIFVGVISTAFTSISVL